MTDMQAALGLCQLQALDWILERRRHSQSATRRRSSGSRTSSRRTTRPMRRARGSPTACESAPGAPIGRTELMRRLLHDGIATRRGVMAIHEEAAYADPSQIGRRASLEHTEAAAREALMLPLFPDLTEEQQDYVIERLAASVLARAA